MLLLFNKLIFKLFSIKNALCEHLSDNVNEWLIQCFESIRWNGQFELVHATEMMPFLVLIPNGHNDALFTNHISLAKAHWNHHNIYRNAKFL